MYYVEEQKKNRGLHTVTFSDLSANENNLIRVNFPKPPEKPVCIIIDRVCAACFKTGILNDCWSCDGSDCPTPYPPEKILHFQLDEPLINALQAFYDKKDGGYYLNICYFINITVFYLDRQLNRGRIDLCHKGKESAWLKSYPGKRASAAVHGKALSYALKRIGERTVLDYTLGLAYEFMLLEKARLLIPSLGPCSLPRECR